MGDEELKEKTMYEKVHEETYYDWDKRRLERNKKTGKIIEAEPTH